jgi:predicted nucleotidyltransferase
LSSLPSPSTSVFDVLTSHATELRTRFGLKKLGVFGSCARGEERASSDADVLVEFLDVNFDLYMDLKFFLEELLGRSVDLVMESALKPAIRESILRDVRYVA